MLDMLKWSSALFKKIHTVLSTHDVDEEFLYNIYYVLMALSSKLSQEDTEKALKGLEAIKVQLEGIHTQEKASKDAEWEAENLLSDI